MYKRQFSVTQILYSSKLLFLLLVAQLVFILFFTLDFAAQNSSTFYPSRVLQKATGTNFAYYTPISYDAYNKYNNSNIYIEKSPYADFDKLDGLIAAETVYTLADVENRQEMRVYPSLLSQKLTISMRKGVWLSEAESETLGVINCVTSRTDRKLNEMLEFHDETGTYTLKLKIVGIAAAPYPNINMGSSGEMMQFSSVVRPTQEIEISPFHVELLWVDSEQILAKLRETPEISPYYSSRLLFFDDISDEQMKKNAEIIKDSGRIVTIESSRDQVAKDILLQQDVPILICVWLISIIGFCCAIMIMLYNARYYLKICQVCGQSKRQSIGVGISVSFFVVLCAVVPLAVLVPIAGTLGLFSWEYSFIEMGWGILALGAAFFLLLSICTTLVFFRTNENGIMKIGRGKNARNQ